MRKTFAEVLYKEMEKNKDIYVVTADLGMGMFDRIRDDFPDRFLNTGASEQGSADICVGLAYSGAIPVFYSITTFLLYRAFETIRTYINHENLDIKLVGSGRNRDYAHDGISHWSDDAGIILNTLPNIVQFWPKDEQDVRNQFRSFINNGKPSFMSLKR